MRKVILLMFIVLAAVAVAQNQWAGRRMAFLGDSMTDPRNSAADVKYWDVMRTEMGIEPYVFARSGYQWDGVYKKAVEMADSLGQNVDAIIIWAGTNDYNHSKPIGQFFTESTDSVNYNGNVVERRHREWLYNDSTFTGNINRVLKFLKTNYPDRQIVIMTPIHRGYAKFSSKNVQPDEDYANELGLYIEDYVDVLRQASSYWAVPLVDMFVVSGIYPNLESNDPYVGNVDTDRLHPNNAGHRRIARTLMRQLEALPVDLD